MNNVNLIGNLTKDPELRSTTQGVSVCTMTIAVNKVPGGKDEQADFFQIIAWRGLAENVCKYLKKGSKIAVSGSLQTRNYEDKNGNKKTLTEVLADTIDFLHIKNNALENEKNDDEIKTTSDEIKTTYDNLTKINDEEMPF